MKVSAFTFIRNGQILGYPFLQSIQSVLPIVEEFVVNVGESEDDTLALIKSIPSSKIRIIQSKWNDSMQDRGFVYGQQKMIAQYNCTGDWAFYIECDEVYHESELEQIRESMKVYLNDLNVEALVFDFYHFYGNSNSYLNSPGWYRSEARIIKNWLPKESGVYQADTNYQPNKKQKKHRLMIKLEKLFRIELSKKHFKLI